MLLFSSSIVATSDVLSLPAAAAAAVVYIQFRLIVDHVS